MFTFFPRNFFFIPFEAVATVEVIVIAMTLPSVGNTVRRTHVNVRPLLVLCTNIMHLAVRSQYD